VNPRSYLSAITVVGVVASIIVVGALFVTNPATIGPLGVTLWFVALLVALQTVLTVVLYTIKGARTPDISRQGNKLTNSARQALLIALGLTVFLALSSLKQLALRDVLIISAVLVVVEFYFRTRK
jgi:hypothetical protein